MNKRTRYLLEDTFHHSGKDERCKHQALHNKKATVSWHKR